MKKPIVITSLSMRFYVDNGWTLDLLEKYVKKKTSKDAFRYFDGEYAKYWIANPYTVLDVSKLMEDGHVGELRGKESWGELEGLTDLKVLENRNW